MKSIRYALAAAATLAAGPALAHHPLGGLPMVSFSDGVLSGVGHPLLGFDHLAFVAVMALVALYTGRVLASVSAYVAAMLVGTLLMSVGVGLPIKEVVIAISLLTVGGIALLGRTLTAPVAMTLFALFGLFHGSAFGDAIAAQEAAMGAPVLLGYLLGLGAVQVAIALGVAFVGRNLWQATDATALQPRLAGAVVAGMGLLLSLEAAEGAVFAAMGWG